MSHLPVDFTTASFMYIQRMFPTSITVNVVSNIDFEVHADPIVTKPIIPVSPNDTAVKRLTPARFPFYHLSQIQARRRRNHVREGHVDTHAWPSCPTQRTRLDSKKSSHYPCQTFRTRRLVCSRALSWYCPVRRWAYQHTLSTHGHSLGFALVDFRSAGLRAKKRRS